MKDDKKKKIKLTGAFLLAALLFYILMCLTPMYADDYSYRYMFIKAASKPRVTNFSELVTSQIGHYRYVNGRTVVHTLAQIFLMWGKPVFNVINTGSFLLLSVLIYYHGTGEKNEISLSRMALLWFILWISTPAFGQSFLWLVGSCNYLYGPLIVLLYLIPFTKNLEAGEQLRSAVLTVLYLPIGILTGWTVENAAAAAVIISLCCIIFDVIRFQKVPGWMITGFFGSIVGASLIVMSPGQEIRAAGSEGIGGLAQWIRRAAGITVHGGYYLIVPILIICVLIVIYVLQNRGSMIRKCLLDFSGVIIFALGTLASIYSMVLAPVFPERTWSVPVIFITITLLQLLRLVRPVKLKPWLKPAVCIFLAVFFLTTYIFAVTDINRTRMAANDRESTILEQAKAGSREVEVPAVTGETRWNCFDKYGDLVDDPGQWPNTAFAMYYDMETVKKAK